MTEAIKTFWPVLLYAVLGFYLLGLYHGCGCGCRARRRERMKRKADPHGKGKV